MGKISISLALQGACVPFILCLQLQDFRHKQ